MKKIFAVAVATVMTVAMSVSAFAATPVYFNDFEDGAGDAKVVGSGKFVDDADKNYGKVFHNAVDGQAQRTNYLLLPEDVLAKSADSKELTIQFWVNVGTATDYFYTPLFSAYGAAPVDNANTFPMMVLQSRTLAQVNCAGWSDFTIEQNKFGENKEDTTWLDDKKWHLYTATFDEEIVKIYIDGVLKQEWDGSVDYADKLDTTVAGLYSNGADLKYVCLGGNQAWNWGDPDAAYMFDDVAIYNKALSEAEIKAVMTDKAAGVTPETGDFTAVLPVALVAVAAMAVVVVMKKRTVAE